MNTELRRNQLTTLKAQEVRAIAKGYNIKVSGVRKAKIIEEILNYEANCNMTSWPQEQQEEEVVLLIHGSIASVPVKYFIRCSSSEEADSIIPEFGFNACHVKVATEIPEGYKELSWWPLVREMNTKDGQWTEYSTISERPLLQQILLHACRDLYLDSQRAIKVSNGDKSVKQFGPVFVSKKHDALCMKDAMAKATVKSAAEKVLSKDLQKKFILLNPNTKKTEFKQAVQVLDKLSNAGLIQAHDTDKDYAKFYSVHPEEIITFLRVVGCLK